MLQPSPPALLWGGYATGSDKAGFAVVRLPRMEWRPHQRREASCGAPLRSVGPGGFGCRDGD